MGLISRRRLKLIQPMSSHVKGARGEREKGRGTLRRVFLYLLLFSLSPFPLFVSRI